MEPEKMNSGCRRDKLTITRFAGVKHELFILASDS
jgi:hypothetical protein